ncbi:nitroreductase family protein [Clostridium algidicarnis]|uniref:Nitroreductase family protein n=1 Tax=Clostridium algidicarnis TaxID=37659 RepID=A0ABS6C6A3_9CLOT|nr:nitroreductase family protein [Clostridium algidicarnis]MBU3207824.1 nitroreductase family protein [Clostridium algidicarnis]MBU3220970.1 nitroreductase family protein [Clostridium algidicarnis]MCB2285739.1 nitroreductase family protein [Clostridium algidicarnis]
MIKDLILKNRTYRRFYEEKSISKEVLMELIDLARISSSGGNLQSLKYILSNTEKRNELVFDNIKWAGYLKEWHGPEKGERPAAYIIMVQDKDISNNYFWDHGIAAENILLGAVEKDLGGCMFGSVNKLELSKALSLPSNYEILMVIALGTPKENVILEDIDLNGDIKYYRDEEGNHYVPKRKLQDIVLDI